MLPLVSSSAGAATDASPPSPGMVVPRWEWRLIGRSLPLDRSRFLLPNAAVPTSSETYLLSTLTPHNVKVRGAMLEIKRLVQRTADGLEQWRPTARGPFPLDVATQAELWDAWGIAAPPGVRAVTSLADLERDVVASHATLRRVDLVKRRTRLTLAGCSGELVALDIAGEHWSSVAFEDVDPVLVRAAVAAAGLDPYVNVNYPAALKRIMGLPGFVAPPQEGAC